MPMLPSLYLSAVPMKSDGQDDVTARHRYGLFGNFLGDEELEARILRFENGCTTGTSGSEKETFERLAMLADDLPPKGRLELAHFVSRQTTLCDALLPRLLNYCLTTSSASGDETESESTAVTSDEDFVWITRPESDRSIKSRLANPLRYPQWKVLLAMLPRASTSVAASVSWTYLDSFSTKYRSAIILHMVSNPEISNEEIVNLYESETSVIQASLIEKIAKSKKGKVNRVIALETLLEKSNSVPQAKKKWMYMASSDYICQQLKEDPEMELKKWSSHRVVYLSELRQRLEGCRIDEKGRSNTDRIKCGKVWNKFVAQISSLGFGEDDVEHLSHLLNEYIPCRIKSSVPANLRVHLEELSASGQEDVLNFESVEKMPLPDRLLLALPKKVRRDKLLLAFKSRDWDEFQRWRQLVSINELTLAEDVFSKASAEDLWKYIINADKGYDRFFHYFANILDQTLNDECRYSGERDVAIKFTAINSWQKLHKKSTPDQFPSDLLGMVEKSMTVETFPSDLFGMTETSTTIEKAWSTWYKSYMVAEKYIGQVGESLLNKSDIVRPLELSQVTLYACALRYLIEGTVKGIRIARGHVCEYDIHESIYKAIEGTYEKLHFCQESPKRVIELKTVIEDLVLGEILGHLRQMLQFDPREDDRYLNKANILRFGDRLEKIIQVTSSEKVLKESYEVAIDCLFRATAQDKHISPPNNQKHFVTVTKENKKRKVNDQTDDQVVAKEIKSFVFFDSRLHMQAAQASITCLKALMLQQKASFQLSQKVWNVLKENSKVASLDTDLQFVQYCCTALPLEIRNMEMENIVRRAQLELSKKQNNIGDSWLKTVGECGLLDQVLGDSNVSKDHRQFILQSYGDFDTEAVREILRAGTENKDGHVRAHGHSEWLKRAVLTSKSSAEHVQALKYTASRIKNEAGLYKSSIFSTINALIAKMVTATLDHGDSEAASALAVILAQILQNDLERRDSVALRYFRGVASKIMKITMAFDPAEKLIDVRTSWINCAVTLVWLMTKTRGVVFNYTLPLNGVGCLPVSNWIKQDEFDRNVPHREFPQELASLQMQVNLPKCVKKFTDSKVFGPEDAVALIVVAIDKVWDKTLYGMPLQFEPYLPEDSDAAKGIMLRLGQLFTLCSAHWEDSDFLVVVFDNVFGDLLIKSPQNHFFLAEELLKTILSVSTSIDPQEFTRKSHFFENPRLAKAVDNVMRYAVEHNLCNKINYWLPYWGELQVHGRSTCWQLVDKRMLRFFLQYNVVPPRVSSAYDIAGDTLVNQKCSFVNELLKITSSAIVLPQVLNVMVTSRPDALIQYCKAEVKEGVFQSKEASNGMTILYEHLDGKQMENFPPEDAELLASYAYDLSCDDRRNLSVRTLAMEVFVTCPISNNARILHILADETLEPPLLEAVTLRIFSLDSPWHILAHLLSVEVLRKRRQSTTASLLAHVSKHVPINQAVQALTLLLAPSRRDVLGVVLHKAIIRMLLETGTDKVKKLLQSEWDNNNIHKDVRHELIILCLRSAVTKDDSVDWEWGILHDLASRAALDEEASLLLLSATTDQYTIHQLTNRWQVDSSFQPPPEHPSICDIRLQFQRHVASEDSGSVVRRDRFYSLAEQLAQNLSQPDLRRVALRIKWMLSRLYHDLLTSQDDQNTLAEIEHAVLTVSDFKNWTQFWITEISQLYGRGLSVCITKIAHQSAEWKSGLMTREQWMTICADHDVGRRASRFISELLLSGENDDDRMVRRRSWIALKGICNSAACDVLTYLECFDEKETGSRLVEEEEDARRILEVTSKITSQLVNTRRGGYGGR